MLGGMFSSCACAMCLRTVSEYWKRSPQMRQCHWSRAKMYGRHSGLFGSSLGLGIFKSCKKNRNYHSGRADYDSGDRAGPAACHGFREVAKTGAQPEPARPRFVRRLCVAPAFGLRPRARLRPRLCTKLVNRRENLSVVRRPLQLSGGPYISDRRASSARPDPIDATSFNSRPPRRLPLPEDPFC